MNSSESSEDECNMYVNAALKLNALNRRAKHKIKDNEDWDDDVVVTKVPENQNSSVLDDNKVECKDSCDVSDSEEESDKNEDPVTCKDLTEDDLVMCIDDAPPNNGNSAPRRSTRNSNKKDDPIPAIVEAAINIDDSIEQELNQTYNDDSLQLSQEENEDYVIIGSPPPAKKCNNDNYEVSIKVLWRSNKLERFEIRRYETFQKVFKHFADLEGVSEDQVLITKKNKRITPFDTPISINWSIIDILDGGIVSAEIAKKSKGSSAQDEVQENTCKIKVQTSDKRTLIVILRNDEAFTALAHNCSEQLNIPKSKMKFYFDGELVDDEETPESLDIDDEACIDLKISK